jgi:hypothetical protein
VGASVSGTVVDARTGDTCSAELHLSRHGPAEFSFSSTNTEADGTFKFRGLESEHYDLASTTMDGGAGVLSDIATAVGIDTAGLTLAVQPAAKIRIRYDGKATYGYFTVQSGGVQITGDGVRTGTSAVHTVPAGVWTVRLTERAHATPKNKEVTLAVGEEKEVVFADDP